MRERRKGAARRLVIGAAVLFVLIAAAIDWWGRRHAGTPARAAVPFTRDHGLTTNPALSADGKLLAYASDRGGPYLDLWLQPFPGGVPRRLTNGEADSHSPSFSPDGAWIAFRSERGEGGAYVISTGGGAETLAAPGARDPRFSRDGRSIAYWVRGEDGRDQLWVVAIGGGAPRRLCDGFAVARYPLWSPDGRLILFLGSDGQRRDWWVVPAQGGAPEHTGAYSMLRMQAFGGDLTPTSWTNDGVLFGGLNGTRSNIWHMLITPRFPQASFVAKQITIGEERQGGAVEAAGTVVFAGTQVTPKIWSVAETGDPHPLAVLDGGVETGFSVSASGRSIAFRRGGDVWVRDLDTGREVPLNVRGMDDSLPSLPLISPDGGTVAYRARGIVYAVAVRGAKPKRLCSDCARVWNWSPDGARLLAQPRQRSTLSVVDTETGARRDLLHHPDANILEARFSPDGRWIALYTGRPRGERQIFVAPYREGPALKPEQWIAITAPGENSRNPVWAADGSLLYFLSDRDGFLCLWAQRLDPATRRPKGKPFAFRHFHRARYALANPRNPLESTLAATRGGLVLSIFETTGNLWMLPRP
jgi:Tol biopolymer transport system component